MPRRIPHDVRLFVRALVDQDPRFPGSGLYKRVVSQFGAAAPRRTFVYKIAHDSGVWVGGAKGRPRTHPAPNSWDTELKAAAAYYGMRPSNANDCIYSLVVRRFQTTAKAGVPGRTRFNVDAFALFQYGEVPKLKLVWRPRSPVVGSDKTPEKIYRDNMKEAVWKLFPRKDGASEALINCYSGSRSRSALTDLRGSISYKSERGYRFCFYPLAGGGGKHAQVLGQWFRWHFTESIKRLPTLQCEDFCEKIERLLCDNWVQFFSPTDLNRLL